MTTTKLISGSESVTIDPLVPLEINDGKASALIIQRIGESCCFDVVSSSGGDVKLNGQNTETARLVNGDKIQVGEKSYWFESSSPHAARKVKSGPETANASSIDETVARKMAKARPRRSLRSMIGARSIPLAFGVCLMGLTHYGIVRAQDSTIVDVLNFSETLLERLSFGDSDPRDAES